jgi:riboflavin kinase/FMN adenylyltransferase
VKIREGLEGLAGLVTGASVVTVGVFDGVHRGHADVLARTTALARELGCQPVVITFRRHPDAFLRGKAPKLIVSLRHRLLLFARAGLGASVVLDFDERIRRITAEEFAREILATGLRARALVLGFDAALGKDRQGTPERFAELGAGLGFEVRVVPPLLVGGAPISSTAIRTAIESGELAEAERMLGRPVSVLGKVVAGSRRGRLLGFPTANLDLEGEVRPPAGVYAVRVLARGRQHGGVMNIGQRPTFGGQEPHEVLEVHLLEFAGDLYGEDLEVWFVARLRGERKFPGTGELVEQITRDVEAARRILAPGRTAH